MNATRRYVDHDGFTWQVCEIPLADARPAHGAVCAGSLYFLSRLGTRVLTPYPSAWETMSWDELDDMRRRAVTPIATAPSASRPGDSTRTA